MKVPTFSLAHSAVVNVVTRIVALALGLVISVMIARLGTQAMGLFALFMAAEAALLALCSGGGIALARLISHDGAAPGGAVSALAITSVGVGVCLAGLVWGLSLLAGPQYSALYLLACALPWLLITPSISGLWLGQGRMVPLAWITLATPLLACTLWAAAALGGAAVEVFDFLVMWFAARALVGLVSAWVGLKATAWRSPDTVWLRSQWGGFLTLGLGNLISLLNYKVDIFLLEYWQGLSTTGVYAFAVMAAELLWFVSSSLSQAAFARIGSPDKAQAVFLVLRVMHLSMAVLCFAAPLWWLVIWLAVPWGLGASYAQVSGLLAVLLPGVLAYAPASVLSAYFTNHAARPGVPAAMASLSLLINVALCMVTIPRWGAWGAALATTVSYSLTMVCLLSIFRAHSACTWRTILWPSSGQLRHDVVMLLRSRSSMPPSHRTQGGLP